MRKSIVIVTGASSGMGQEFVRQLDRIAHHIDEIWMIARRKDRLDMLADSITHCKARCFGIDLCKDEDVDRLADLLFTERPDVRILVNAAGVGRAGIFSGITGSEAVNMVDVNVRAVVAVTHIVLPFMSQYSRIIQLCSASAFFPQKEFAVYAASKSFVLRFSLALQKELRDRCIWVTIVCPGPVDTEFLEIANKGQKPKWFKKLVTVKPEPVVRKALKDARDKRLMSIYGLPMKAVYAASKLLPHI